MNITQNITYLDISLLKINNNEEENKCGICLELFEINQIMRRFPCRHVYHKDCADRWLQVKQISFQYDLLYKFFRKVMFVQFVVNHLLKYHHQMHVLIDNRIIIDGHHHQPHHHLIEILLIEITRIIITIILFFFK